MKDGTCPAEFKFLERKIGGQMMGMGDDDDMTGERKHEMWDDRGLPERSMEEHSDGGLLESMRDWLAPPDIGMEMGTEMETGMMGMDRSMMGKSYHCTLISP